MNLVNLYKGNTLIVITYNIGLAYEQKIIFCNFPLEVARAIVS